MTSINLPELVISEIDFTKSTSLCDFEQFKRQSQCTDILHVRYLYYRYVMYIQECINRSTTEVNEGFKDLVKVAISSSKLYMDLQFNQFAMRHGCNPLSGVMSLCDAIGSKGSVHQPCEMLDE